MSLQPALCGFQALGTEKADRRIVAGRLELFDFFQQVSDLGLQSVVRISQVLACAAQAFIVLHPGMFSRAISFCASTQSSRSS